MKIKYILFAVLLSLVACAEKPAIKIYVSPTGDDNNTGEAGFPVQSIAKARDLATPIMGIQEVQIILGDGIYYLPQTIVFTGNESGSEKYPVIYKAENRGKAILSGGSLIEVEWEPYEDGVFKTRILGNISIDQLYVNGKRQRMARFPNAVEGKNVFEKSKKIKPNSIYDVNSDYYQWLCYKDAFDERYVAAQYRKGRDCYYEFENF